MIKAPDDFLLIALPETISSDLYVVMKNCLDGNQSTRMSAQEAVKQLTGIIMQFGFIDTHYFKK